MAAEAQPGRPQDQRSDPAVSPPGATKNREWLPILDVTAKLVGAGAVVAATVVANSYQSAMTATNMLVQREKAGSELRAGMFHDLIGPLVGSGNNTQGMSVNQELLLVELLALNFHEHFVLKPLMMDVDNRLRPGEADVLDQAETEIEKTKREDARKSLRSVAHQIVQRQLASLTKAPDSSPPEQQTCIYDLQIEERKQEKREEETDPLTPCSTLDRHFTARRYFDDLIGIDSPNGIYTLAFTISRPKNWADQIFDVSMRITGNIESKRREKETPESRGSKDKKQIADQDFALTWFDFPFSDNTLLSDGSRFSLVIDSVEPYLNRVKVKLVWFPQDYFAAHERPTNYREMREKLGIKVD